MCRQASAEEIDQNLQSSIRLFKACSVLQGMLEAAGDTDSINTLVRLQKIQREHPQVIPNFAMAHISFVGPKK